MQEANSEKIQAAVTIVRQAIARIASLSDSIEPSLVGSTLGAVAERLYSDRRRRDEHFPRGLFGEPAWDMLLALFIAREEGREMSIGEAGEAAGLNFGPARTVIGKMQGSGLVVLHRNQRDRRRRSVFLTDHAIERLSDYLTTLI